VTLKKNIFYKTEKNLEIIGYKPRRNFKDTVRATCNDILLKTNNILRLRKEKKSYQVREHATVYETHGQTITFLRR